MYLTDSLQYLKGVGPLMARRLSKLNLLTVEDLINHYPYRYDDFSVISQAMETQIGQKITLRGELWSVDTVHTRSRKILVKALFNDGTTPIELVWFNQPWLGKNLTTGDKLQISGKLDKRGSKLTISSPVWEKIEDTPMHNPLHTGRLVPIYPETSGITSKWLRTKISQLLPEAKSQIADPLPKGIQDKMLALPDAIQQVHFPENWESLQKGINRLAFDEMFYIQLATLQKRAQWQREQNTQSFNIDNKKLDLFLKSLSFELTTAQQKVLGEIILDLKKTTPMNRLVQGEVGSGKTVVAAIACYLAYLNNLNSLLMAPTEILAFQHYEVLKGLLEPFGVKVGIYTGSKKQAQDSHIIVGTHALLSPKLETDRIGLVVIDEQQRFGVEQRGLIRHKSKVPHFLTMTATPIPRTVALTLYSDLDLSVINELPQGRKRVKTYVVPKEKRLGAYEFIDKKISEGDQVYIITPLIEESETQVSAKAAKVELEKLKQKVFPHRKLGLLHGKLKAKEKEQVIQQFKNNQIDILISTSVVEVGVDISNATIMMVEGADRFGLAQLHQLRGRVGRGQKESFCLLFSESEDASSTQRLKNLETTHDGLTLSELDLKIRGGGDIFGARQSGRWELKMASFSDLELIERTRQAAQKILEDNLNLDKYPLIRGKLSNISSPEVMPD